MSQDMIPRQKNSCYIIESEIYIIKRIYTVIGSRIVRNATPYR